MTAVIFISAISEYDQQLSETTNTVNFFLLFDDFQQKKSLLKRVFLSLKESFVEPSGGVFAPLRFARTFQLFGECEWETLVLYRFCEIGECVIPIPGSIHIVPQQNGSICGENQRQVHQLHL